MYRFVLPTFCLLLCVALLVPVEALTKCRAARDCKCGDQCVQVRRLDKMCDSKGRGCVCKPGCNVLGIFIPRGKSGVRVYGNWCSCMEKEPIERYPYTGTPACTRAMWRGVPKGTEVFEANPRCNL